MVDTQVRILRQVLLKIASEQLQDTERAQKPEDVIAYAKELETKCEGWL